MTLVGWTAGDATAHMVSIVGTGCVVGNVEPVGLPEVLVWGSAAED